MNMVSGYFLRNHQRLWSIYVDLWRQGFRGLEGFLEDKVLQHPFDLPKILDKGFRSILQMCTMDYLPTRSRLMP